MPALATNRHVAIGLGPFTKNLTAIGVNKLILVVSASRGTSPTAMNGMTLNGNQGQVIYNDSTQTSNETLNTAITVFTDSQIIAGAAEFIVDWPVQHTAHSIIEYSDAAQIAPFIDMEHAIAELFEADLVDLTLNITTGNGKTGLFFITGSDSSYFDPTLTNVSANLTNQNFGDATNAMVFTLEDTLIESNNEDYSLTWNHGRAGQLTTNLAYGFITVNPVPPNQPPTADDDDTFSISDNIQNGDIVGTYTATDSDGTVVSYAIDNAALAISNAGVITIADNTGITAGTPITATVTATDNDGATDTGLITITVTEPRPGIVSTTPIRLGESFTITVDSAVDLTTRTYIRAYLGDVSCGLPTGVTTNTVTFNAPSALLNLSQNHNLVLRVSND